MMKNNHVNSFRAVVIRLVLILVIFFLKARKLVLKISIFAMLSQSSKATSTIFRPMHGMTSLHEVFPILMKPDFQFYLETFNLSFHYK